MRLSLFSCPVMSDSATPWTAAHQTSLSLTISQSLPKFQVHCIDDAIQPSHPLTTSSSALNLYQHQGLFLSQLFTSDDQNNGVSASASVLPMSIQGWFPLRLTGLISLLFQGTLRSLLQHHSSKASILWRSAFFMVQLSQLYVTTGKTIALTMRAFVSRVMSLLFSTLSSFLIAFLPRSKRLWFHGCGHHPQWF